MTPISCPVCGNTMRPDAIVVHMRLEHDLSTFLQMPALCPCGWVTEVFWTGGPDAEGERIVKHINEMGGAEHLAPHLVEDALRRAFKP